MKVNTMKVHLITILIFAGSSLSVHAQQVWEKSYGELLRKYVLEEGVDYAAWKKNADDLKKLDLVVEAVSQVKPERLSLEERKAFLINAYNAWVLKGILDKYPIKSVRDIAPVFGFFTQNRIIISGEKVSLNHLEKQLIFKQFKDPRLHFVINCGSVSCPPLQKEVFTALEIERQLNRATQLFLNDSQEAVQIDSAQKKILVSALFDWYAEDFKAAGGVEKFINSFRSNPLPNGSKISFIRYNWQLNQSK